MVVFSTFLKKKGGEESGEPRDGKIKPSRGRERKGKRVRIDRGRKIGVTRDSLWNAYE